MSEAYCCLSLVTTFLLTWACLLFSKAHFLNENNIIHFVKSVRIRSFSGPYSPTVGLNTEKYSVSLRTHSEWGKIRTSKTPNTNTFHTFISILQVILNWVIAPESSCCASLAITVFVDITAQEKRSFLLRFSSLNVTKSVFSCGFGHIYWRNSLWKTSFFVQCMEF